MLLDDFVDSLKQGVVCHIWVCVGTHQTKFAVVKDFFRSCAYCSGGLFRVKVRSDSTFFFFYQ